MKDIILKEKKNEKIAEKLAKKFNFDLDIIQ